MSGEDLVRSALAALGPAKVEAGLVAFEDPKATGNFDRCFLARCYGEVGALLKEAARGCHSVDEVLGLSGAEVWAVADAFDNLPQQYGVARARLRELIDEYLASRAVPAC